MTLRTLIFRSLRFHARSHAGVVIGAAIASTALIGALVIGDSVKESLKAMALSRLGRIEYALFTKDRLFQADLGERIQASHGVYLSTVASRPIVPAASSALWLEGMAAKQDGSARANRINIIGVAANQWRTLAGWGDALLADWTGPDTVFINETLAHQLSAATGDEIVVRVRKPTALALDAVVAPRDDNSVALRLRIAGILPPEKLGDFSLAAGQAPPPNLFLPLTFLNQKLGLSNQANLMVMGLLGENQPAGKWNQRVTGELALAALEEQLKAQWRLEDAQLSVRTIEPPQHLTGGEYTQPAIEISSPRIFLETFVENAALQPRTKLVTGNGVVNDAMADVAASAYVTNGTGVLTYLANLIQAGGRTTPYSMITAMAAGRLIPTNMRNDEILVNNWLAEDLNLKAGDSVQLSYYAVDSGSSLIQRTNTFHVREIVPLKGAYADRALMPEFPGIAKAESTRDWDAGFPLTYPIRDQDEDYWKKYRGTPKGFITLAAGQSMWSNRFGNLTAIRYAVPTNSFASSYREIVYRNLLGNLNPEQFGFRFDAVREQALQAAERSQDFGGLFLGFSIFLVTAALLLMALLFQFGLEQRSAEVGIYLALGFSHKQVRRMFLGEGVALAMIGVVIGVTGGIGYAKAMLWGLRTIWRDAVGASTLQFFATPLSLGVGVGASLLVAALTLWLTLRKLGRQPVRALLAGALTEELSEKKVQQSDNKGTRRADKGWAGWIALGSAVSAVGIVVWAFATGERSNAEAFFGAGSLLLTAGLFAVASWLRFLARGVHTPSLTLRQLGVRACARRRKRSVATVALLASGCFLIVAIGAFRLDANQDAQQQSSGTGGFALIGQTTLPVVQDLNSRSGREAFGLGAAEARDVHIVPFRVREGDEASCLNLNAPRTPRLLGVKPGDLAGRFTFSAVAAGHDRRKGWETIASEFAPPDSHSKGAIPDAPTNEVFAIADANSIEWSLHKKVGDTIDYTDEKGRSFKLRLVGAVANSILQGSLIIDEKEFLKHFPGESGYRMFLIDAPTNSVAEVSEKYTRALQDMGLELTPAAQRLNAFNAVQNTYLGTFQVLGGLGLLLGSAGLGIVVLRNVLERRGEFGLFTAVGFTRGVLRNMTLVEHGALLALGLGLGIVAALLAVLPSLLTTGRSFPYLSLGITLGAVIANGLLWTWIATKLALRGNLLSVLRNE